MYLCKRIAINNKIMKKLAFLFLSLMALVTTSCNGQQKAGTEVLLETTAGDIRILLYDETPGHRDNFIKNVQDGKYDGVTFHRVINNFMIQTGDPDTRPGEVKDTTKVAERIPSEVKWPALFHKRGMVGAARDADDENPERMSDKFQFYIITGKKCSEDDMDGYEDARAQRDAEILYTKKQIANAEKLNAIRATRDKYKLSDALEKLQDEAKWEISENPPITYSKEMRKVYKMNGGAPWLDNEYTVFGEVLEGMAVVEMIQKIKTDANDVPVKEIRIKKATVK